MAKETFQTSKNLSFGARMGEFLSHVYKEDTFILKVDFKTIASHFISLFDLSFMYIIQSLYLKKN